MLRPPTAEDASRVARLIASSPPLDVNSVYCNLLQCTTTITQDNAASWRLFEAFARRHGATLQRTPRFERERHFAGAHDTEWEARIAPLPAP